MKEFNRTNVKQYIDISIPMFPDSLTLCELSFGNNKTELYETVREYVFGVNNWNDKRDLETKDEDIIMHCDLFIYTNTHNESFMLIDKEEVKGILKDKPKIKYYIIY